MGRWALSSWTGPVISTAHAYGANGVGSVFKLTPTPTPPWTYTSLHDFTDGSDGTLPYSNVVFDGNGNLYGTASAGGTGHCTVGLGSFGRLRRKAVVSSSSSQLSERACYRDMVSNVGRFGAPTLRLGFFFRRP